MQVKVLKTAFNMRTTCLCIKVKIMNDGLLKCERANEPTLNIVY